MKRLFAILCLCAIFIPLMEAKVQFEVRAGFGASNYRGDDNAGNHFSGKIGAAADVQFSRHWSIEPGLFYASKGTQFSGLYVHSGENFTELMSKFHNSLHYIEVPVLAVYKIHIDNDAYISVKLGPYFALGIKGTANVKTPMYNDNNKDFPDDLFKTGCNYDAASYISYMDAIADIEDITNGKGPSRYFITDKLNRLDIGIMAEVGITYRHLYLGYNSSRGLTKLCDDFILGEPHNMVYSVVFGYKF